MRAVLGEVGYQPLIILAITALCVAAGIIGLRFLLRRLENHCRAPLLSAMDKLDQGIILFSDKREVVFCNQRYREIYGLTLEQVKPGTPIAQLIQHRLALGLKVPAGSDDYVKELVTAPVTISNAIHEFSDGRIIAYASRPVPGGGGIATHEDITERETLHRQLKRQYELLKEQQEQLRARNLQFDAALNHMSEGLCIFDGEQRLIVSNDRYAEIYGLRPDAIRPGMTLREITDLRYEAGSLPAMSREDFDSWRNSIFVANSPSDTIVKHTNGRVFAIHHRPMSGGGWIATHDDITEREVLHTQLKEQLEIVEQQKLMLHERNLQFDIAINNISQGLCFFDGAERLIICNNRHIEMYGLDPASVGAGHDRR